MSFFSRSKNNNNYKNANQGGNHYQKKGLFGNLFNMMGSGSRSGGHYNQNQNQFFQQNQQQNPQQFNMQNPQPMQQGTQPCVKCSSQIPSGSKFCLECGEKVSGTLFCLGCGEKLPPNAKFCMSCGTKLNG